MPYDDFKEFVESSLFSNSDEVLSFYAQVRRFIFHFMSVYSKQTPNDKNTKKQGLCNH